MAQVQAFHTDGTDDLTINLSVESANELALFMVEEMDTVAAALVTTDDSIVLRSYTK